ncbi:MAG: hypothetical protein B5M51_00710 [Anaerolinea sp. 4484_236]|nr:MAG: hypothetical protein B5M51_00710 [Anaerolinea sp. 4484_236]
MMSKTTLILLALDESPILQLMERSLYAVGYATAIAHDRASLNKIIQKSIPALVLVGEKLDGEKGTQLIVEILERFPTLPIIFLATKDLPMLAQEALQAGASGYLHPPLRTDDIVRAVQNSLKRAQHMGDWVRREVKRSTASLEKRVNELEILVTVGRDITGTLDLDSVLNSVVSAAVKLTHAEEGSLLLLDETSGDLYMRAGHNFEEGFARSFRLPVKDTLAGQVIQTGKPVILSQDAIHKIQTAYLVQSLIYVPLRLKERVIGVLGVDNRKTSSPFTDRDALLISVLADYAAIAIENARLYQVSESERAKFEAVLANMDDALMLLDENEHIQLINTTMCKTFGVDAREVHDRDVSEAIPHEDLMTLLKRQEEAEPLQYHEINLDDGSVFSAQHTLIPGVGSAITMQDISYLKELDRLKDDFVHTVSHDLRSPLTAVLGYAELLERIGELNDQQKEFVRRIQTSVQDITSLVNDLLDLGSIEAGFDARREIVQLDGIVRYTLSTLEQRSRDKKQILDVEIASGLPAMRGNPVRLRQMLDNLIGNAIKYTPVGENVRVKLHAEGNQIIIQISDNGPGIPQEDQPHIFEKFYRASNIPSGTPGSGLGLAIVNTIVESHQGRIWVESALGKGSTFFVVLPTHQKK